MTNNLYGKFFAMMPEAVPSLKAISGTQRPKKSISKNHISIQGPLSRYEEHSWGGTSYEAIADELAAALSGPSEAVTLHINSPGGEIDGCYELCEKIRSAKSHKPIYAKISGYGCSAAYWIASACTEISATPTSLVGSLGVVAVVPSREEGALVFVSSQSPKKSPDPSSDEGALEIQNQIDVLCHVFLDDVAKNRGVDFETVKENFGKGSVFIGQKALESGLIDKIEIGEVSLKDLESKERERVLGLFDLRPRIEDLRRFITQGLEPSEAALELRKKERPVDELSALSPMVNLEESNQLMALARKIGVAS